MLRQALDEIRVDLQHTLHNRPLDDDGPCNRPDAGGQPPPQHGPSDGATAPESPDESDAVETMRYCCEQPHLEWYGDPRAPGIHCVSCGYIVADCGEILIYVHPTDDESSVDVATQDPQKSLW